MTRHSTGFAFTASRRLKPRQTRIGTTPRFGPLKAGNGLKSNNTASLVITATLRVRGSVFHKLDELIFLTNDWFDQ